MGTQQLLLITLGAILVGLAIFFGIEMVQENTAENNRQELIARVNLISDLAQAYVRKPVENDGGGGSFEGFDINDILEERRRRDRIIGRININVQVNRDRIIVNARGVETGYDGNRPVIVRGIIESDGLTLQIRN